MTQEQMSLEQFNARRGHSNLGMDFQRMLDHAHDEYRERGYGRMQRNEQKWEYTSRRRAESFPPERRARTGHGRDMIRVKSDPDYAGGLLGRYYTFDAKEFSGTSIPLSNFDRAQVENLCASERGRCVAGFMVYSKDTAQVFFVRASQVRDAQDLVLHQGKGRGKNPKSFNREWLIENAVQIGVFHTGQPVLWLEVLGAK